jgi:hypothetical protein
MACGLFPREEASKVISPSQVIFLGAFLVQFDNAPSITGSISTQGKNRLDRKSVPESILIRPLPGIYSLFWRMELHA